MGADLIAFPELFVAGYPPEDLVLKPAFQAACMAAVEELAKETADGGVVVIEVNDNPNLEHGIEDKVGRDAVWQAIASWFTTRIDAW